jgi:hypothetical protein
VLKGSDYFNPVLYTGTGSTRTVTGVGFQPDLILFKERSEPRDPVIFDAVRGAGQYLFTNTNDAEDTATTMMSAFTSDGFTVGASSYTNANTQTYVAWNWNAGGSNATNTSGTITSTVRANTTAGFSIVTYTGNGTNGATVGHGLGVTPSMMIFKKRSSTGNWIVVPGNSTLLGGSYYLQLNTTSAIISNSDMYTSYPGTGVFYLSTNTDINASGSTYVAYCFAPISGFSAFGSYTGNSSTDGPFVYTGFRPEFVMIKGSSVITNWTIVDAARNTSNVTTLNLRTNSAAAETTDIDFDLLSNGFKLRGSGSGGNNSGSTYIYMAFAENPFKNALAR